MPVFLDLETAQQSLYVFLGCAGVSLLGLGLFGLYQKWKGRPTIDKTSDPMCLQ